MSALHSLKVTGRTSASTDGTATGLIATKSITIDSDGFLRFTDASGKARAIPMRGDFAVFVREVFTGTGGIAATTPMFDSPLRTGNGVGGRADS